VKEEIRNQRKRERKRGKARKIQQTQRPKAEKNRIDKCRYLACC
jgi:hypothetical protein